MKRHSPLISAVALREQLQHLRIVDCSHDLGNTQAGLQLYSQAHIPTALHAHLDNDLSGLKTGSNGRHPLPAAADFVGWLGAHGISSGDSIVAYDRSGGMYAARLWWLLRWMGHENVRVLDGGWQAWVSSGGPVSHELPHWAPVNYGAPTAGNHQWVDADFIEKNLIQRTSLLVDARGAERFSGAVEPIDPRGGHILGAVNRPCTDNLGADGHFKSAEALAMEWQRVLAGTPSSQMVSQCGSGVTACHNLLALEVAGLPAGRLYPGSWSEWCSDPLRPIETVAS